MGGKIIENEAKTILNKGIEQGIEKRALGIRYKYPE